jgi:hypothetical protein
LAVEDIVEKLDLPNGATSHYQPVKPEQDEASLKLLAFKKRARDLVQKEKLSRANNSPVNGAQTAGSSAGPTNHVHVNTTSGNNTTVLTLYGSAPQPKQLFSSLQVPKKIPGEALGVTPPLREAGLPHGISTTQIIPTNSAGDKRTRIPTLGELFPTPASVPPLQPPKPSKLATTRSSTVGWYQPSSAEPHSRNSSYFRQPISTGQWIDYSNASPMQTTKRKQRDRAMSLGGSKAPQLEAEPAETEAAKLDALFRSAYSSFAPTVDNSAAIVPEGMVDRIWWQRIGEKSFERFIENASRLEETFEAPEEKDSTSADSVDEAEQFREAVEWYEKYGGIDPQLEIAAEKSAEEKDVEEVLEGISELLETLNSYQRIRNVSLKPAGSQVGILATPDALSVGTPSKPSDQEMATYEILKSQLSLMIATLPPFAVAKLQPNRLAELGISTKIAVEMENHNGVMEEDETGARAKAVAATASASVRTSQSSLLQRNSSTPSYGNQYPSARPQSTAAPQYYASQTPIRPPINMQRPPATAPVPYQMQSRPMNNTPYRPQPYGGGSYGTGTPNYAQTPAPRPVQQPYSTSNSASYPTQGYARPVSQSYQSSPQPQQTSINARYASQPSYTQQTPVNTNYQYSNNATGYNNNTNSVPYSNGTSVGRQPSPQKPAYSPQPMATRPSYPASTPTPPVMQNRGHYLQNPMTQSTMVNGGFSQSQQSQSQPQITGFQSHLSNEQQSNLMEQQRAKLAAQQGTQEQARQIAQASMALQSPKVA